MSFSGGLSGDLIEGSNDPDLLVGGEGDDTLIGYAGNDTLIGGEGSDTFVFGDGFDHDIILDFDPDLDRVEVHSDGISGWDDICDRLDDDEDGNAVLTLDDGSTLQFVGVPTSALNSDHFTIGSDSSEPPGVLPCFTPGTLIETERGAVPVETLMAGDRVLTRDAGYQPLVWVGRHSVGPVQLLRKPALRAVHIAAGALGAGLPVQDMTVSPQHRVLFAGLRAELLFGAAEVLVPALHLLGLPGITRAPAARTTYIHILFDAHQIVLSDGIWTESFQPGAYVMSALDAAVRDEIVTLFPELATEDGLNALRGARMSVHAHEARALLADGAVGAGIGVVADAPQRALEDAA